MRAAAKSFKVEGLTEKDVLNAVKADLAVKGVSEVKIRDIYMMNKSYEAGVIDREPYVTWYFSVEYSDLGDRVNRRHYETGRWSYRLNGFTGEVLKAKWRSGKDWVSGKRNYI